jgi:hypothetical protein
MDIKRREGNWDLDGVGMVPAVLLAELLFSSRPLVSEKACRVSGRGRMFRKVISYGPSIAVASVVSFLMIYAYTRLLTPGAFGKFSLIFSVC